MKLENLNKLSLVITIPKSTSWDEYQKELDKAKNGEIMNFKVTNFPRKVSAGDKCYVVYGGMLKGWMKIVGFSEKNFICTTTGKKMAGKFVERSGNFHPLDKEEPFSGFRGFRYVQR